MADHSPYLYIYGLVRRRDTAPVMAVAVAEAQHPLMFVEGVAVAALVSSISMPDIAVARHHLLTHNRVLERVMDTRPILPLPFGLIIENRAALQAVLRSAPTHLTALLDELEGTMEVSFKVTWDEDVIRREVLRERPELGRADLAGNEQDGAQTYYGRIEQARRIEVAIKGRRAYEQMRLVNMLSPYALHCKALDVTQDFGVLNLALLIEKKCETSLIHAFKALEKAESGRLFITYTAPLPPYHFAPMDLDWRPALAQTEPFRESA
jgi:hypothetical protein